MPLVLVINAGSSSVKFGLYREDTDQEEELARGAVEGIGPGRGEFWAGESHRRVRTFIDHGQAIAEILHYLEMQKLADRVAAVGHRVVHGGADYTESTLINNQVLDDLRTLVPFAPLHLPPEIAAVEAVSHVWPTLPQVACFDTAFHRTMPQHAQRYPLPEWVWEEGVQHYGFHGLSYTYIVETLGEMAKGKTVIAHLGNGASMAAVLDGECRDTTMGFTPTGGLVMGSRSGDLDPGILLYLLEQKGLSPSELKKLLNHESGLKGLSEGTTDMRTLLANRASDAKADLAVTVFCYHARRHIGALAAVLNGVDRIVFTGGIGERAAVVREEICQGLAYLGVHLDGEKNAEHQEIISSSDASCEVRVIPTKEDLVIARETRDLLLRAS